MRPTRDEVLEEAARLIEEADFLDMRGVMSKRKRDREDAQLRMNTRIELKNEMARHLRAFKNRADLDPAVVLARIAKNDGENVAYNLLEAWPLAWKGLLNIYAKVRCNSNSIPPEIKYSIELTDEGRALLAEANPNHTEAT